MPGKHAFKDKVEQEVAAAIGMDDAKALSDPDDMASHPDQATKEVAAAIGMPAAKALPDPDDMASHPTSETHNPLDIPFGYEVGETHGIKIDNSHSGKDTLDRMSENVLKSLLETQLTECPCKNKARPKNVRK